MAEDVDAQNPKKKIKLDEESTLDDKVDDAKKCMGASTSGMQQDNGDEEISKPGTSDSAKADKTKKQEEPGASQSQSDSDAEWDDMMDSDSSVSALSDLSGLSGEDSWKGQGTGPMSWVYRNMEAGVNPRDILEQIIPDAGMIPNVDDFTLWKLVINIVTEPPARDKLPQVNTIQDVCDLLRKCSKIMVLTGAGVSVSCGIPDFRSRNGVYARLAVDFPDLPDPQAMFDIKYFKNDQRPFFKFAKEIFPGQFEPSKCHKFIKLLESQDKLLRNYTQNIDTLEQVAGITNIIQCHGSFATATCMTCSYKCPGDDIKSQINDQIIPMCPKCEPVTPLSVMKPDIVFFGESLPDEFHNQMSLDKEQCDLLIVMGSSLKVRPVALIPNSLPPEVPQILINKEALRSLNFDVELLGDCDTIIGELCRQLGGGWESLATHTQPLTQISLDELLTPPATPTEPSSGSGRDMFQIKAGDKGDGLDKDCTEGLPSDIDTKVKATEKSAAKKCDLDGKVSTSSDSAKKSDATKRSALERGDTEKSAETENANDKKETTDDTKDKHTVNDDSGGGSGKDKQTTASCASTVKPPSSGKSEATVEDSDGGVAESQVAEDTDGSHAEKEKTDGGDKEKGDAGDKAKADAGASGSESGEPTEAADVDLKSMWKAKVTKLNVAQRLGPNQYCLIPPHRYVFNEAEVFTAVDSDDDSDSDYDMGLDLDSDDDDDLHRNNDATTDGEQTEAEAEKKAPEKAPEKATSDNDTDNEKPDKSSVKSQNIVSRNEIQCSGSEPMKCDPETDAPAEGVDKTVKPVTNVLDQEMPAKGGSKGEPADSTKTIETKEKPGLGANHIGESDSRKMGVGDCIKDGKSASSVVERKDTGGEGGEKGDVTKADNIPCGDG